MATLRQSQIEVFWVVTSCSIVGEDGGRKVLRNAVILLWHYTAS